MIIHLTVCKQLIDVTDVELNCYTAKIETI